MNVNIYADLARPARNPEREVGALGSNAAKRSHHLEVTRHFSAVLFDDSRGELTDIFCFGSVETRRANESSDPCYTQLADCFRRRSRLEKADGCRERNFVPGAYGYDACDQLVERRAIALGSQIEHCSIGKLLDFQPDEAQNGVDVERALGNRELIQ
jgi:hypothetical protein